VSINGMRSPASAGPLPPAPALGGDTSADAIRRPVIDGTGESLERLQHRAGDATVPQPRNALVKLGSARPEAAVGALSDAVQTLAARVSSDVAAGKVALRGQPSPAAIKAATVVAAMGLVALSKDLFARN
jgi:hypothetical protein